MSERQDPFAKFQGVIGSLEEIREHIGEPVPPVVAKVMDHIDPVSRPIIAKSPFIIMASATPDGYPDISPKGDPAGFVNVLDEKYLAIPDRPGNKRVDTFRNLLQNPYLAILFMIPGKGETLRITGQARIVRDLPLRESMAIAETDPLRWCPQPRNWYDEREVESCQHRFESSPAANRARDPERGKGWKPGARCSNKCTTALCEYLCLPTGTSSRQTRIAPVDGT